MYICWYVIEHTVYSRYCPDSRAIHLKVVYEDAAFTGKQVSGLTLLLFSKWDSLVVQRGSDEMQTLKQADLIWDTDHVRVSFRLSGPGESTDSVEGIKTS